MNHRETPHRPAGTGKALRCLCFLLLPASAPLGAQALPRSLSSVAATSDRADQTPYLLVTGAPPLRFQETPPPPVPVVRLAAVPSPVTPASADIPAPINPSSEPSPTTTSPVAAIEPVSPAHPTPDSPQAPAKTPAPILPDNARPAIRPEDFLPYFQLPGSGRHSADVILVVPVQPSTPPSPGTLPPSSATYTQTPK